MKTLLVSLFMLSALTAQAGIIKSKNSPDYIKIEFNAATKTVLIEKEVSGLFDSIEAPLQDINFQKESLRYIYKDGGSFGLPYGGTGALFEADIPAEITVVFLVPALALDTLFLPVTLTSELLKPDSYMKFKKDMKVIEAALADKNFKKTVSSKKFDRFSNIVEYFFQ